MANDFSSDSNCLAVYRFESGALTTDSKGSNTLTASASAPTSDGTNYKEGSGSARYTATSSQCHYINDSSLPSDWPLKNGTTNTRGSFTCWFRAESFAQICYIWSKHATGKASLYVYLNTTGVARLYSGYAGGTSNEYLALGTLTATRWYFLSVAFDCNHKKRFRVRLWDDTAGSWVLETWYYTVYETNIEDAPFCIGSYNGGTSSSYFNGEIDEFTVWKTFLSDADTTAIKNGTYSGTGSHVNDSTWYMDPINGSDTNEGLTWATAKRSIAGIAGIGAGDTVKIAKTPAPVSLGSITWTNNSNALTLNSALTATITNCETATGWTAETNIAIAASTTRVQGSYSIQMTVNTAFTTGRMAYLDLGASGIDLSAYTHISFWIRNSGSYAVTLTNMQIDLCSDQLGTTVVDSFVFQHGGTAQYSYQMTLAKSGGGYLGSSIKSIRFYANSDPGNTGNTTLLIDNVIACGAAFNHNAIIGPSDTGPWFTIQAIDGTSVTLGNAGSNSYNGYSYAGSTGAVTTYYRQTAQHSQADGYCLRSGTEAYPIIYDAGYDTSSGLQDGVSCISFSGTIYAMNFRAYSYIRWKKFIFSHADTLLGSDQNGLIVGIQTYDVWAAGIRNCGVSCGYGMTDFLIDGSGTLKYTSQTYANANSSVGVNSTYAMKGFCCTQAIDFWPGEASSANAYYYFWVYRGSEIRFEKEIRIHSNNTPTAHRGAYFAGSRNVYVHSLVIDYLASSEAIVRLDDINDNIHIGKLELTASGATLGAICAVGYGINKVRIDNFVNNTGNTPAAASFDAITSSSAYGSGLDGMSIDRYNADNRFRSIHRDGEISDHITGGQAESWAYGGTGISMLMNPTYTGSPIVKEFFVPVEEGVEYNLKFMVRKTGGSPTLRAFIFGAGITSFSEEITLTESWAQYTSTAFTAAYDGYVTILLQAWDGSTTGDIGIDAVQLEEAA